ncbi:Chaperone protein ClpB4, mitochondrial [Vitis vinifera]|uniref:Chaperone protein ClpB4, mitochondrial n=1 Tax=Vitis vinifera TaxID=29760 RepID=A0A438F2F0_VITVI|nr:Chaperone protein ClpB4, mitochondrial [Vitis vinifera]
MMLKEEVWQGRSIVGETSRDEFPMEDWSSSSLVVFRGDDSDKRKLVKSLICPQKADLIFRVGVMNSKGAGGGVLVFWDKRILVLFGVGGVYGPPLGKKREDFWAELVAIKGLWIDPWCVEGDFNIVRLLWECNGGYNFRGTFSLVLAAKLKALKSDLKSWNKRFGNASIRKKLAFNETDPEGKYQALEKYGNDLTELARRGKLDPVIGRDDEIRRCIQILSRRTKNNPVIIGEPGVGKTAIAEGKLLKFVFLHF